jgi:hypothetical protein
MIENRHIPNLIIAKNVRNVSKFGKAEFDQVTVIAIVEIKDLVIIFHFANGFLNKQIILQWLITYHTMVFS